MSKLILTIIIILSSLTGKSNSDTRFEDFNLSPQTYLKHLSVKANEISSLKIVNNSSSCLIVEIHTASGQTIYNVIAAILTLALPSVAEGIFNKTVGDPEICNAVYDVTEALIDWKGKPTYTRISKWLAWLAKRDGAKSIATIETSIYEKAELAKKVFEFCEKLKWNTIYLNSNSTYPNNTPSFRKVACIHTTPCTHSQICGHRVECSHLIQCRHLVNCTHRTICQHSFPCQHFYEFYGSWIARHVLDYQHEFDLRHEYDYLHTNDAEHSFDLLHEFDMAHRFDYLHTYDYEQTN